MGKFSGKPAQPSGGVTRRRFVQGLAASGAAAGLNLWPGSALARESAGQPTVLTGTEFDLTIGSTPMNFTGTRRPTTSVNGSIPAPLLRWKQGTTVTMRVTNRLTVPTSIHWHGILVPFDMDGVPGISFPGIAPGATFVYRFPVRQAGTYWYHSHSGFQEQTGLYGPLVIEPANPAAPTVDRDYVVMLSDWTDENPERIYEKLKNMSDYYNYQMPTTPGFLRDAAAMGLAQAWQKRKMWNAMRMNPTDFLDVSGATYTYLANGVTPAGNWTAVARAGERVRLRFINGSSDSYFDVRIPGMRMTVVAADGQDVEPVTVDEFRIAVAETYDVVVQMPEDRAYTIFCQSMDRSGYARATLAPERGMQAAVPKMDPKTWLSMADMGMDMQDMQDMQDMDGTKGMKGMHGMSGMESTDGKAMPAVDEPAQPVAGTGPEVDARSVMPSTSLSDPGPRLRDNGRRVLTYADLHTLGRPLDPRAPSREIILHLTGNMARFIWGFDGKKFSEAEPLRFHYGERLRITLVNDTMMNHPIHLHGMFSELEDEDGRVQVRKHTLNVQPGKQLSYQVSADAPGQWAFHCHLLYHMEAGMFRKVVVA